MRVAAIGLLVAACSGGQDQAQQPLGPQGPEQGEQVTLPSKESQCSLLIAVINGGVQHVDNEADKAKAAGQNELMAMKNALNRVADELERTVLSDDALLRLGGFYVGALRVQAGLAEELSVAIARGDKGLIDKKTEAFAQMETQESAIVGDINRECPTAILPSPDPVSSGAPPPPGSAPVVLPPSAAPPTPQPAPQPAPAR